MTTPIKEAAAIEQQSSAQNQMLPPPRVGDVTSAGPLVVAKGLTKSFDGRGNFAMGIKEQIIFPEIDYDKVDQIRGLDIVICTTAQTDAEAKALLRAFNMPFAS